MNSISKNIAPKDPFADLIQIRKIGSSGGISPKKGIVEKSNPDRGTQINNYERRFKGSHPAVMTGLKNSMLNRNQPANLINVEEIPIPRQMKKASLKSTVKMIPMSVPRFGRGQAIIASGSDKKIEKLNKFSITANVDDYTLGPTSLLEDVQKEIDISENQLEKLHSILKRNNVEENDSFRQQKTNKSKKDGNSKERVISTLTTLNKKLSDMQEKYFGQTKTTYKSINDIPYLKIKKQSDSDIELNESNSDVSMEIEEKKKILEQFHLSKINMIQSNAIDDDRRITPQSNFLEGRNVRKNVDKHEELTREGGRMNLKSSTGGDSEIYFGATESNSLASIPEEAKKMLRNSQITRILNDSNELSLHDNGRINNRGKLCDKEQNFSNNIPDILLPNEKMEKSDNSQFMFDSLENESFSEANVYFKKEKIHEPASSNQTFLQSRKNTLIPQMIKKCSTEFFGVNSVTPEELIAVFPQNNPIPSKSNSNYYDCMSKVQSSKDSPSTISKKKIFYDKFNYTDMKIDQRNVEVNSAPNLPCQKSIMADRSPFDESELQRSITKSDFLSRKFKIDASGNFAEQKKPQVAANRSDQFFSGGLDFRSLMDDRTEKFAKNSGDLYNVLTRAMSNSFYELPSQNQN